MKLCTQVSTAVSSDNYTLELHKSVERKLQLEIKKLKRLQEEALKQPVHGVYAKTIVAIKRMEGEGANKLLSTVSQPPNPDMTT